MRYFLDTEFIESGGDSPLQLISIGIVSSNGETFYAISSEFRPETANDWVKEHVLAHLESPDRVPRKTRKEIAEAVLAFIGSDRRPEFWGYYADYDWVLFCQLFGSMVELPEGFPMYCRDLKQWADDLGISEVPGPPEAEHNALADAGWNSKLHFWLTQRESYIIAGTE